MPITFPVGLFGGNGPPPLQPYTAADFQADLDAYFDRQWLSEDGLTNGATEWVDRANGVVATKQGTVNEVSRNGINVMETAAAGYFTTTDTLSNVRCLLAMVWNDDPATFAGNQGVLGNDGSGDYIMRGTNGASGIYHFGPYSYGEFTNGADFSGQNAGYLPRPDLSCTIMQRMGNVANLANYRLFAFGVAINEWNGGGRAILVGTKWLPAGVAARMMAYLAEQQGVLSSLDRSIPFVHRGVTKEPAAFNSAGRALCAETPCLPWSVSDSGVDSQSAIFGMPEFVTDQGDRLILAGVSMIDTRRGLTGNPLNPDLTAWTKTGATTTVTENVDGVGVDTNTYTVVVQEATTLEFNVGTLSGNRSASIMGILRDGSIPAGAIIQFYNGSTPINVGDPLAFGSTAYSTIQTFIAATSDRVRITLPYDGTNYTIEFCRAMCGDDSLTTDTVRPWSKAGNWIGIESAGLVGSAGNTCYTFSSAGTIGLLFSVGELTLAATGQAAPGVLWSGGGWVIRNDSANDRIGLDNGVDPEFFVDLTCVAGFNMLFFSWDGVNISMWTKDGTASIASAEVPATGNTIFLGNRLNVSQIDGLIGVASWHESVLTAQNMSDINDEKVPLANQELTRLGAITGPV